MRRHPWLVVSLLAVVGVLLLGAFPTRAYLDQVHHREELADRARALAASNQELTEHARRLESDETIEQLARERYHLVRPGEEAYAILPEDRSEPPAAAAAAPAPAPEAHQSWWSRAWARVTALF